MLTPTTRHSRHAASNPDSNVSANIVSTKKHRKYRNTIRVGKPTGTNYSRRAPTTRHRRRGPEYAQATVATVATPLRCTKQGTPKARQGTLRPQEPLLISLPDRVCLQLVLPWSQYGMISLRVDAHHLCNAETTTHTHAVHSAHSRRRLLIVKVH